MNSQGEILNDIGSLAAKGGGERDGFFAGCYKNVGGFVRMSK